MSEDGIETILIIPTFMKGLEDVDELRLRQAVEVCDNRVEFMEHVVLLVFREWPTLDADGIGPRREALVRTCETPRQFRGTPPP